MYNYTIINQNFRCWQSLFISIFIIFYINKIIIVNIFNNIFGYNKSKINSSFVIGCFRQLQTLKTFLSCILHCQIYGSSYNIFHYNRNFFKYNFFSINLFCTLDFIKHYLCLTLLFIIIIIQHLIFKSQALCVFCFKSQVTTFHQAPVAHNINMYPIISKPIFPR